MIEYWHWHTNHFGTETYWVGILPHDQQPGRVYAELSRLGADFRKAGSKVVGLRPDAQVGLLYSARSKWGLAFQACFSAPGKTFVSSLADMDQRSYHRIFEAFYRGTFDAGFRPGSSMTTRSSIRRATASTRIRSPPSCPC